MLPPATLPVTLDPEHRPPTPGSAYLRTVLLSPGETLGSPGKLRKSPLLTAPPWVRLSHLGFDHRWHLQAGQEPESWNSLHLLLGDAKSKGRHALRRCQSPSPTPCDILTPQTTLSSKTVPVSHHHRTSLCLHPACVTSQGTLCSSVYSEPARLP